MISKRSFYALKAVVFMLWPAAVWATQITLANTLLEVPGLAWLMVFMLSTVSGLAALLNQLKLEVPKNWIWFLCAHMLGSWLAGLLIFLTLESLNTQDFVEAVSIALAAYAGARLMDRWSELFVTKLAGKA